MGASFATVHVFTESLPNALRAVQSALGVYSGVQGYRPVPGRGSRRFVLLEGARWLSVFDSESESLSMEHEALAEVLSAALRRPVLALLVFDSDNARYSLFDKGRCIDRVERPGVKGSEGRAVLWKPVLAGRSPTELAQAWNGVSDFAEEGVAAAAQLLGLDAARATGRVDDFETADVTLDFEGGRAGPSFVVLDSMEGVSSDEGDWVEPTEEDFEALGAAIRGEQGATVARARELLRAKVEEDPSDDTDDESGSGGALH